MASIAFLLVFWTMLFSQVGAFSNPQPHHGPNSLDCLLTKVFDDLYKSADDKVKDICLYVTAHWFDERVNIAPRTTKYGREPNRFDFVQWHTALKEREWRELISSILSDSESQRLMESIVTESDRKPQSKNSESSNSSDWFPNFPFEEDSPLAAWRQDNHNKSKAIVTVFEENDPPMQVCQNFRNSYISACILFLSYNENRYSPPKSPWKRIPMHPDILSHGYRQRMIYNRIVKRKGFSPKEYLLNELMHDVCACDAGFFETSHFGRREIVQLYFDWLREQGAALITAFKVGDDFFLQDKLSYDGTPQLVEGDESAHTMVLVGAREDANNKIWFLIQTSWSRKQFVEMSLDYFKQCGKPTLRVSTSTTLWRVPHRRRGR